MEANKSNKQVQVDKNKMTILVAVAIASVAVVGSLMICRALFSQISYLNKVVDKKEVAVKQLEENIETVTDLKASFEDFTSENPNMLGGNTTGTGPRDGDNGSLVLDALPSKYDFPALTSSLERMLAGYTINGITGIDDALNQSSDSDSPVEIPFGIEVVTSYDSFRTLIDSFDRSIRPFQITKLELSGSNNALLTIIDAKTFYMPERGLQITEESVQ